MYLVETKNHSIKCKSANEVKKIPKDEVVAVYTLNRITYDDLVATSDIQDCIYKYLKGKQLSKEKVVEYVSLTLSIKKAEVTKTISLMKREKIIYSVKELGWIGID